MMTNRHRFRPIIWLVLFLAGAQVQAQGLQVSLWGEDTLYACLDQPLKLLPEVTGQQGTLRYEWSDGSQDSLLHIATLARSAAYWVAVTDGQGHRDTARVWVSGLPECVLPGDANGDRLANNFDVLSMGLAQSYSGPQRPQAHLQFTGQGAHAWGSHLPSGVDHVHSDANGDGTITPADFVAIDLNYSAPQKRDTTQLGQPGGAPLFLEIDNANATPGDTVGIRVMLGTADQPAQDVYGLAFSLQYDQTLIDSGSVKVSYTNSWLGAEGIDLVGIDQTFYSQQQVDVGVVRTDQIFRRGYGLAVDITVVIDDVVGKQNAIETLALDLRHILLIDPAGRVLEVDPLSAELLVSYDDETASLTPADAWSSAWNVFPQPAHERLTCEWDSNWRVSMLEVVDAQGRVCYRATPRGDAHVLSTLSWSPGLYQVRLQSDRKIFSRKIMIR